MQYIPSINLIYCLWHSAVLKMQNFVKHARRSFRAKSKIRNKSWPVITISRGIKQVVFSIQIWSKHSLKASFFMVFHDGGEGFIRSSIPDTILGSDAMEEWPPEQQHIYIIYLGAVQRSYLTNISVLYFFTLKYGSFVDRAPNILL